MFTLASLSKGHEEWATEAGQAKLRAASGWKETVPGREICPIDAWDKAVGLGGLLGPTAWSVVLSAASHQNMTG